MGRPSGRDPRSAAEARAAARGDNAREKRRAGGRADVAAAAAAAVEDGDERAQATERASRDVRRSTATAKSSNSSTQLLSEDSLARLNAANEKAEMVEVERAERKERRQRRHDQRDRHDARRYHHQQHHHHHYQDDPYRYGKVKKRRVVSGPALEEGRVRKREIEAEMDGNGGGGDGGGSAWWSGGGWRRRKGFCTWLIPCMWVLWGGWGEGGLDISANDYVHQGIAIGLLVLLLIILIPVGVLVVGKNNRSDSSGTSAEGAPANANLKDISESDIPVRETPTRSGDLEQSCFPVLTGRGQWCEIQTAAKGTILDPFVWYDTLDFNVTYTDATVGGLPVMGLNSSWDDSARANDQVPALDQAWEYGKMPIRGVNVGGWLSLEPFITPSLFEPYDSRLGVVDEYTLTRHLGPRKAAQTLEKHYATFVTEQTFAEIAAAGLDHVRIPFSYWAVATYPDDPYVPQIAWRYLLRGIEWARKYGLRIKLDLHGAPGSQNGWNHSGRQGVIGWLNSTEGAVNAQRTLDLHDRLSRFFAQPRYANILTIYGLLNEPKMIKLPLDAVLDWSTQAMDLIRRNGITAHIAVGDGFLGLPKWKGRFAGQDRVLLDVHQYVIFNADQLSLPHDEKLKFACEVWSRQMEQSGDPNTGLVLFSLRPFPFLFFYFFYFFRLPYLYFFLLNWGFLLFFFFFGQLRPHHLRRMVPSRHGLHPTPEQRRTGRALDGDLQPPDRTRHDTSLPARPPLVLQLRHAQRRRPIILPSRLPRLAPRLRPSANARLRTPRRLGLVLLDLGHRTRAPVELEEGPRRRSLAGASC